MPHVSALLLALLLGLGASRAEAQQAPTSEPQTLSAATSTAESTASVFLRSVRAIRWATTAQLLHPETLERFRFTVTMIVNPDTTGALRTHLTGTDSLGALALTDEEVFDRAVTAVIDDMPGLMHALYDRDDEVIGAVAEAPSGAHAVYRTTARISGALPEVKVMQLEETADGWRVRWSDELEVIEAALRGVGR